MFKKLLFAVFFLATTANVSGSIPGVKRLHELRSALDKRQSGTIPISELPPQCQKICTPAINALNSISKCSSATCICTKTVDSSFQGCINCIAKVESSGDVVKQLTQLASEYNELCKGTGVSSLSVAAPSTTTTSSSTHSSTSKTSSTSSHTTSTTTSSGAPTPSTTSSSAASISSSSTTTDSLTVTTSISSATSLTSSSVILTPTSTTTAIASPSATRSPNAGITRANAGAGSPLIALIITLFAVAF